MKITIVTVGKVKEKFYRDAIAEYAKRLGRYCTLEILEVADEKTPDGAAPALEQQIIEKEGDAGSLMYQGGCLCHCVGHSGKAAFL